MKKFICVLLASLTVLSLFAEGQKKAKPNLRYDWANFGRYDKSNKEVKEKPIAVFMGDSITDGWARLDPNFFKDNNYIGRGISGQTTMHMLVRFRNDVIALQPKVVVILAGTNDIALNNGYISLENMVGNLISMCEIAKANNIKVILCSELPVSKYGWRPEVKNPAELIKQANVLLKDYAAKNSIKYLDYYSVLTDEIGGLAIPKHSHDSVHPNMVCYKIMEDMVVKAIDEVTK